MDQFERVADVSNERWERVLGVNVNGPMYVTRAVVKHFLTKSAEQKGRIVNVGSLASIKGAAAGVAYTTSKHALLGLSRSTSWAYAKEGIQTNILLPGGIKTNIVQNSPGTLDKAGLDVLMPAMGSQCGVCEPIDAANAILYLASAVGLNGAELTLDRGWSVA
jgi:NAD(P)-dependent dehydrogenase (short-subunit alcohol dehydrogenase family)